MSTTNTTHDALLAAIRTQARIGDSACELEIARQHIRQVRLSRFALLNAGLSVEAADSLTRMLSQVEDAIADAARAADSKARDAQSVVLNFAESLAK